MSSQKAPTTLVVSLHLNATATSGPIEAAGPCGATVDSLLSFFGDHDVPATWNFADPAASPLADRVRADDLGHEIAILAGADWAGSDQGRHRFAEELSRHIAAARCAGTEISTVSLSDGVVVQNPDILVQQGITAICQPHMTSPVTKRATGLFALRSWQGSSTDERATQPRPLRWGLWLVPAGCDLVHAATRRTRQHIDQLIRRGGLSQCHVDVPALLSRSSKALGALDSAFSYILAQRDLGRLRICTMAQATVMLKRRSSAPARSILQRQAA